MAHFEKLFSLLSDEEKKRLLFLGLNSPTETATENYPQKWKLQKDDDELKKECPQVVEDPLLLADICWGLLNKNIDSLSKKIYPQEWSVLQKIRRIKGNILYGVPKPIFQIIIHKIFLRNITLGFEPSTSCQLN